jgi:pyruvate dehydrogenase (quinone)
VKVERGGIDGRDGRWFSWSESHRPDHLTANATERPPYGTGLKTPDFAAMARAAGMTGIRIEDPDDVREGLREALAADGPVLVDVLTDPNALSMPPKITGEQVKGFALAMSKLVRSGDADEVVNMARSNLRNLPRP